MNDEVLAWISAQVEVTGEITEPRVRPWSTVLRVPTANGVVWFKSSRLGFDYEAALLELIRPLAPELVTEVIASRPDEGWLLMADAGELAHERAFDWSSALARYAELQRATVPLVDELLARGVFDLRIGTLRERLETLVLPVLAPATAAELRAQLPRVLGELDALADGPVTLDHGDLHPWNVFVRDGQVRILDWGDANVAHPLFSLSIEWEPAARTAFLAGWGDVAAAAAIVERHRVLIRTLEEARSLVYEPAFAANVEAQISGYLAQLHLQPS